MFKKILPGLILIISCNSANENSSNTKNASGDSLKQQIINSNDYISIRDKYIKHFKSIDLNDINWNNPNDSILIQEKNARLNLENKLKNLIDFPQARDFKDSQINLVTLFQDYGFGLMDGLIFKNDSLKVYCTTTDIFNNFFKSLNSNNFDKLDLKRAELILNEVFYYDAKVSIFYMDKKLKESGNTTYGLLGSIGQDFVFEPQYIYTLSSIDNQIVITEQSLSLNINKIKECYSLMDSINSKSKELIIKFLKTGEIDSTIIKNSMKLEDFAYNKYCDCFDREFTKSAQNEKVNKQIEQTKNYIHQ